MERQIQLSKSYLEATANTYTPEESEKIGDTFVIRPHHLRLYYGFYRLLNEHTPADAAQMLASEIITENKKYHIQEWQHEYFTPGDIPEKAYGEKLEATFLNYFHLPDTAEILLAVERDGFCLACRLGKHCRKNRHSRESINVENSYVEGFYEQYQLMQERNGTPTDQLLRFSELDHDLQQQPLEIMGIRTTKQVVDAVLSHLQLQGATRFPNQST